MVVISQLTQDWTPDSFVKMTVNDLRNKIGKIPQSLIEKSLRSGKIRLNRKKIKSSIKIRTNDKIEIK